ncbi:MAG: undecaprenyl-diphosphate phosphatase [Planktomarina sp.]
MALYHLVLIALIQGITEFLPISSSGHLILLPGLTGMPDQGNVIDVAAHVGTLGAVVAYFWADVKIAIVGLGCLAKRKVDTQGAWLALCLIIATVPVILLGLAFKLSGLDDSLRSITVIGWTMLIFGVLLYYVDQRATQTKDMGKLCLKDSVILGLWQAIALIPGTSRSGIVITGALQMGFTRAEAARVAMLMSIPTIIASGTLSSLDLIGGVVPLRDASIVAGLSFIAAIGALTLMMRLLNSISYTPYVIYRVVFGVILIGIGYTGALGF